MSAEKCPECGMYSSHRHVHLQGCSFLAKPEAPKLKNNEFGWELEKPEAPTDFTRMPEDVAERMSQYEPPPAQAPYTIPKGKYKISGSATIEKLRAELAKKWVKGFIESGPVAPSDQMEEIICIESFKAGFDACLQALTEAAGECPNAMDAARSAILRDPSLASDYWATFAEGARWQFEQDRAEIGMWKADCQMLIARVKEAEARLAEREQRFHNLGLVVADKIDSITNLQDKLSAAEARVKSLEGKLYEITKDWPHIKAKDKK